MSKSNTGDGEQGPSSVHMRSDQKARLDELLPKGMSRGEFIIKAAEEYTEGSGTESADVDELADAVAERVDDPSVDIDRLEERFEAILDRKFDEITGGV